MDRNSTSVVREPTNGIAGTAQFSFRIQMRRSGLADCELRVMELLLPSKRRGRARGDVRHVLGEAFWILR
jgi:hypothetical protein